MVGGSLKDAGFIPPPVATWTGCYGGVDTGYKWGRPKLTTESAPKLPIFANVATPEETVSTGGALVGVQVGCNFQTTNLLVLGLNLSASRDWSSGTGGSPVTGNFTFGNIGPLPTSTPGQLTTEVNQTCQVHFGPRVGLTPGGPSATNLGLMVYGTGGYAGTCINTKQSGSYAITQLPSAYSSSSAYLNGWFVGGGVDIPTDVLLKNTFIEVEYSHSSYSTYSTPYAAAGGSANIAPSTDEIRVGWKFRFN